MKAQDVASKIDAEVLSAEEIGSTDLVKYLMDKASKVYRSEKSSAKNDDAQSYADMLAEIAKGQATGSLNGFVGTVRPNSSVGVDKDNETNVILNLTAKDASGREIASHNGKSVVTYDPITLKLVSVNSIAAHYAYNKEDFETLGDGLLAVSLSIWFVCPILGRTCRTVRAFPAAARREMPPP